jgi:hypothetical protein
MTTPDFTVSLMRCFCQDWLNRADPTACTAIMTDEYEVNIGGIVLPGLASYVPATMGQLEDFVGLNITVHELFTNGSEIVLRFTEHGASIKAGGNQAAWRGIALFWTDSRRLIRNATEEDYTSRRRQLTGTSPDPIDGPAVAPWSTMSASASAAAEQQVRDWLAGGGIAGSPAGSLVFDEGTDSAPILDVDSVEILDLFSAGSSVGFRIVETGRYQDGLGLPESATGRACAEHLPDSRALPTGTDYDMIIIDAGFAGLRMLVQARKLGYSAVVLV